MDATLTLRDHLIAARKKVDPANCARTPDQASEAATARWKKFYAAKGKRYVPNINRK